jgi:hypothetical protein
VDGCALIFTRARSVDESVNWKAGVAGARAQIHRQCPEHFPPNYTIDHTLNSNGTYTRHMSQYYFVQVLVLNVYYYCSLWGKLMQGSGISILHTVPPLYGARRVSLLLRRSLLAE